MRIAKHFTKTSINEHGTKTFCETTPRLWLTTKYFIRNLNLFNIMSALSHQELLEDSQEEKLYQELGLLNFKITFFSSTVIEWNKQD